MNSRFPRPSFFLRYHSLHPPLGEWRFHNHARGSFCNSSDISEMPSPSLSTVSVPLILCGKMRFNCPSPSSTVFCWPGRLKDFHVISAAGRLAVQSYRVTLRCFGIAYHLISLLISYCPLFCVFPPSPVFRSSHG